LPRLEQADEQPVRTALAHNPNTPAELLARLASDYSWSAQRIRLAVMRHPNVTPELLELLAGDESVQVRNELARLPHAPPAARRKLLDRALTSAFYSIDQFFHFIAMAHPLTAQRHLGKGPRSPYWMARYALALNPAASGETLAALARDGNALVRAAARHQLDQHTKEGQSATHR
ncbi:MAG TPA: hypothetical protein VD886_15590, partial [Herpetosiphonaceae bacterium]|nr:hypothetical protein [Herpetosiphonaceae bacterium]